MVSVEPSFKTVWSDFCHFNGTPSRDKLFSTSEQHFSVSYGGISLIQKLVSLSMVNYFRKYFGGVDLGLTYVLSIYEKTIVHKFHASVPLKTNSAASTGGELLGRPISGAFHL